MTAAPGADPGAGAGRDAAHGAALEPGEGSPALPDSDLAEDYAESAGIDPSPEQVDAYLELEGEAPLGEERPLEEPVEQAVEHAAEHGGADAAPVRTAGLDRS